MNFPGDQRHEAFCEDAFKFLNAANGKYDLLILDPPAFAKRLTALRNALKGYTRLNAKGLERIKSGGLLFTFSCSQVVSKDHFRNAVFTAAAQAGRKVRILHQLHQPADHHQYLSPRRRIFKGARALCGINRSKSIHHFT